ncbi:outer membrane lipoprotein-sorting protein [Paucibacter soli]|uniref:outer membrane lipoprotein-sorting protein n=1 Tax=Paucibacter soli TaxID=3133433 RepID=UPI00309AA703
MHVELKRRAWLALLGALALGGTARAGTDPQALLAASDAVRNPAHGFGLTNTLIEYRQGKQTDSNALAVYSKADASGQFRSLVRFLAPARDAGKLMLYSGRDLWFYDPANRASIRLSPQQRLLGQASNGDVVTVNLARDYQAVEATEEEVSDGDRQPRRAWRLSLSARNSDASYHRILLWISVEGMRPLKAQFLAESGALLKTAFYRRYQKQLGAERPTETVIIDGLDPSWVTIMRLSDWTRREVPEAWLQRDYLPRFQPE